MLFYLVKKITLYTQNTGHLFRLKLLRKYIYYLNTSVHEVMHDFKLIIQRFHIKNSFHKRKILLSKRFIAEYRISNMKQYYILFNKLRLHSLDLIRQTAWVLSRGWQFYLSNQLIIKAQKLYCTFLSPGL